MFCTGLLRLTTGDFRLTCLASSLACSLTRARSIKLRLFRLGLGLFLLFGLSLTSCTRRFARSLRCRCGLLLAFEFLLLSRLGGTLGLLDAPLLVSTTSSLSRLTRGLDLRG